MKTLLTLVVAFVATFAQVQSAPESVAFGSHSKLSALTQIKSASWEIYIKPDGEHDGISSGTCYFDKPFVSTTALVDQMRDKIIYDFYLLDPRNKIFIDTHLKSASGEILFTSSTSFFLDMSRNDDGEAEYSIPEYGTYLYFQFNGVRIQIAGAVSAKATSGDKDWVLDVTSEGVWLPGYFSRSNTYKTLEVTFDNGQTQLYDWLGQDVDGDDFETSVDYASFEGVYSLEIYNGKVEHTRLSNNDGWSSVIEINNPIGQKIEFDFREYDKAWSQPTHIHFCTVDEDGNWRDPVVKKYSSGTDWTERNTEEYDLENGTYFIILEWDSDTKVTPPNNWGYYGDYDKG